MARDTATERYVRCQTVRVLVDAYTGRLLAFGSPARFPRRAQAQPQGPRVSAHENGLIARLSGSDRSRLLALSEKVPLALGTVVCEPLMEARYVYFPNDCYFSMVTMLDNEPDLEVGMIGREGMLGAQLVLGVNTAMLHVLVQGEGTAQRVEAAKFRRLLAVSKGLQRTLGEYLFVQMTQLATAAGCTRFHAVGPRLARWLLMSQDRSDGDSFHLTQEFVAYMLGVRRVGITRAASDLQRLGLIRYRRGEITVLDRLGLEAAACGCYAADQLAYDRLLGS